MATKIYQIAKAHRFFLIVWLTGLAALLLFTLQGVGITHDSILYLNAAENLKNGLGLVTTIEGTPALFTHYAPLYPVFTTISSFGILSAPGAARLLACLVFTCHLLLVYIIVRFCTNNTKAAIAGCAATVIAGPLFHIRMMAWSEELFITFALAGFYYLATAFYTKKDKGIFVAAGFFALAILTRYAGFVFVPLMVLCIFAYYPGNVLKKIKLSVIGLCIVTGPIFLWLARNYILTSNATNRKLFFNFPDARHLVAAIETTGAWILPKETGFYILLFVLLFVAFVLIGGFKKSGAQNMIMPQAKILTGICGWFCLGYLAFIFASLSLADPNIPLDDRILSPLNQALILMLATVIPAILQAPRTSKNVVRMVVLFLLIFTGTNLQRILHHSGSRIKYGRDFTDSRLHETEVVKSAKTLPANAGLYATHFDHIYFYWLLGRPVKQLKSAPDKQTEPLNNAAYLLYFTPCCNENQLSPAALGFQKAETVLENHIYQIRHLQSIP